jgi:N-acetylmuramoyl-L-alanine amidase
MHLVWKKNMPAMIGQNNGNIRNITNKVWLGYLLTALLIFTGCQPSPRIGTLTKQYSKSEPALNNWTPAPKLLYPSPPKTEYLPQDIDWDLSGLNILLDPGHGGKDPGAEGNYGPSEKIIVLDIAKMLKIMLETSNAKVSLTRTNDRFITLNQRALLAQNKRIDFMISIHADAAANRNAKGITILVGRNASKRSKQLAHFIHQAISHTKNLTARTTRTQPLRVLEKHDKPAILIECGFMSNALDIQRLSATWYKKRLCRAIIKGIYQYTISR